MQLITNANRQTRSKSLEFYLKIKVDRAKVLRWVQANYPHVQATDDVLAARMTLWLQPPFGFDPDEVTATYCGLVKGGQGTMDDATRNGQEPGGSVPPAVH